MRQFGQVVGKPEVWLTPKSRATGTSPTAFQDCHPACPECLREGNPVVFRPCEGSAVQALRQRPPRNDFVDFAHQADGFGEGDDDLLVVVNVVGREFAAFAILEPFFADLIAADMKFPDFLGYGGWPTFCLAFCSCDISSNQWMTLPSLVHRTVM
jgi:hypothetical protein